MLEVIIVPVSKTGKINKISPRVNRFLATSRDFEQHVLWAYLGM